MRHRKEKKNETIAIDKEILRNHLCVRQNSVEIRETILHQHSA